MENITMFSFESHRVREVTINSAPWFVAKDICDFFGDTDHKRSVSRIDDDEKMLVPVIDSMGREQQAMAVNESGLYSLLFGFEPDKARKNGVENVPPHISERIGKIKAFKKWVTSEVLPQIRKTGGYAIPKDPLEVIELALAGMKAERARADKLQLQNAEMAPKVKLLQDNLESAELVTINKIAVDLNISAIALNLFLKENAIIYKQGRNWLPYSDWRDCGLFKMDKYIQVVNEVKHTREHLKATQKGRLFILELYKSGDSPREVYNNLREQLTFNLK